MNAVALDNLKEPIQIKISSVKKKMKNKKRKVIISVEFQNNLFNVFMNFNGIKHNIGFRRKEYSANNLAIELANKFKIQYVDLKLYYPQKKSETIFDIQRAEKVPIIKPDCVVSEIKEEVKECLENE